MGDNKITPWNDYEYTARLPDFLEVMGIVLGVGACKAYSTANVRPLRSPISLAMMTGFVVGGYAIGRFTTQFRNNYLIRRQIFINDYVEKHPEDFLSQEPKKYKDVLWEWTPHR